MMKARKIYDAWPKVHKLCAFVNSIASVYFIGFKPNQKFLQSRSDTGSTAGVASYGWLRSRFKNIAKKEHKHC